MASKRKEKELNDLIAREREKSLAKLASSPDLVNERVNPDSNNYQIDSETKVNASRLIKSQLESNQPSNPNKLLLKDLLSIDVNLVDEIEANNPNVRPDFISDEYLKCSSKLDLKVPSDEQNILNSPQDCLEILEAIKPLARIILSSEFDHEKHFYIGDRLKLYNSSDNNISREKLLLEIKLKTLYLITKTARVANEFLIKPQFSLEEFKQLVKSTKVEDELTLVTKIQLTDLANILEGISLVFPEIELPFQKRVIIEPPLFTESNLAKTSTSIVLDAVVAVMVSGKVAKEKIKDKHIYRKNFTIGSINIILDLALEALQQQYGIEDGLESVKVLEALLCHWYKRKNIYGNKISVSGNDILDYLDMKYKNYRGSRCRKYENLGWLLNHCRLLRKIDVCSGIEGINPKNKKHFSLGQETHLIEMNLTTNPIQLNINGTEDLESVKDLIIEFKAGDWFKYFDNPKGLIQYGYLHKESLSSRGMKSAFLTILPTKLRQTQSGLFKIRTLLEESGYQQEYEEILAESDSKVRATKAKDFKNRFDKAIKGIQKIEDPYSISYHHSAPDWVNSRKKKPDNWFDDWLDVTLEIRVPKCLENKDLEKNNATKKNDHNNISKVTFTIKDLESALELYKDNPKVSIRKLTIFLNKKHPWLQKRLDPSHNLYGKLTKTQIQDCLDEIKRLTK